MPIVYFIGMVSMFAVVISVLRINPRRRVNQIFIFAVFICGIYFAFTIIGRYYSVRYYQTGVWGGLIWFRLAWSTTALLPFNLWAMTYAMSGRYSSRANLAVKMAPWTFLAVLLVTLVWTDGFVHAHYTRTTFYARGPFFFWVQLGALVSALAGVVACLWIRRDLTGIKRLEFNYLTLNMAALSIFAVLLPMIGPLPIGFKKLVTIPIVLYGVTGWSIATRRVYDSSQIYLSVMQRAAVLLSVGFLTVLTLDLIKAPVFQANIYSRVAVVGVYCLFGYYADNVLRRWLRISPEEQVQAVKRKLSRAAEIANTPEELVSAFEETLAEWTATKRARLFAFDGRNLYAHKGVNIAVDLLRTSSGFEDGWITTASLSRIKMNRGDDELERLMKAEKVGAVIAPNWRETTPSLLAVFGEREAELPLTYPEVRGILDVVEVAVNHHTHAKLALQARQSEQLAAIGRIAMTILHELRNPMCTLKSFSQLLPEKLEDRKFLKMFSEIIPKEAERIEALAEQLLDLAKPRKFNLQPADLHKIIDDTITLSEPQLKTSDIVVIRSLHAKQHVGICDGDGLRQVLLNLIRNSAEALASNERPRRIEIRTSDTPQGIAIEVEDNGPGLPKKIREKMFREYESSGKQSGSGIGLAICEEIVKLHKGTIAADLQRNTGCLFRIVLPVSDDEDKRMLRTFSENLTVAA